ncbi:MAG: hypothetical protein ACNI3A_16180 [Desulfovibrio sp.]|uniref:hypothetical protein n=1 Tax=Desulfovibrio sp. 7SRBS1 TaxID=3378064 RepID=UPI003B3CC795
MQDLLAISEQNQRMAREIIRELAIEKIWQQFGATANLVGSLRTGLFMDRLDIDFHIYSDNFVLADSFAAMARMAENPRILRIQYANLLETDEKCLEWHAWYKDRDDREWQIDLIHILRGSQYDGYFEKVADRIAAVLTPETRRAILTIKHELPADAQVLGIEVYQAVIAYGVRDTKEFMQWKASRPASAIVEWMP